MRNMCGAVAAWHHATSLACRWDTPFDSGCTTLFSSEKFHFPSSPRHFFPSFLPSFLVSYLDILSTLTLTLTTYMIHSAFRVLDRREVRDVADLCVNVEAPHFVRNVCVMLLFDRPHLTLTLCLKVMRLYSSSFLFHQLCLCIVL